MWLNRKHARSISITNNNESINKNIKELTGQNSEWPAFNTQMKQLIESQGKELRKTLSVREGTFHLLYSHLAVDPVHVLCIP